MKYITFVVPSYNSQDYMRHCIETLLPGGEDVEIIIVNDGSKDDTGKIADEYQEKYPNIVRAVNKENGGHGSGVNIGIDQAKGKYLKVVDSDDWVDVDAYLKFLEVVKHNVDNNVEVDCYFTNFVYENIIKNTTYTVDLKKNFPVDRVFTWKESKKFKTGSFLMMHSVAYSVNILRQSKTHLLEKTFYVDNIYMYQPMTHCKKLYYVPVDFYRYFIGRNDQSVNIENMVKRYDQQLRVLDYIVNLYTLEYLKSLDKKHYKYMIHHIKNIAFTTFLFVYGKPDKVKTQAFKEFWKKFKKENRSLYMKIRWRSMVMIPFFIIPPFRKHGALIGYKIVCSKTQWG